MPVLKDGSLSIPWKRAVTNMTEYVVRFSSGAWSFRPSRCWGNLLRPKSFAGLFGAAPSVALVTLASRSTSTGSATLLFQTRSMMAGAVALAVYCVIVCHLLVRARMRASLATTLAFAVWLTVAFGLQALWDNVTPIHLSFSSLRDSRWYDSPSGLHSAVLSPPSPASRVIATERPSAVFSLPFQRSSARARRDRERTRSS